MIEQIYEICRTSSNVKTDIAYLFYQMDCESIYTRGFSSNAAHVLFCAFKDSPNVAVAFASTLKAGADGVTCSSGCGLIDFTFPRDVQEEILRQETAKTLCFMRNPLQSIPCREVLSAQELELSIRITH